MEQQLLAERTSLARREQLLQGSETELQTRARQAAAAIADAQRQLGPPPYWRLQGLAGAGAGAVDVTEEMREKMAYLLNSISKPGLHGVGRDSHGCIFRT